MDKNVPENESLFLDASQENMQQLVKRCRDFFGTTQDAFVVADSNFHISEWNRAASELFGWQTEEVRYKPLDEILFIEEPPQGAPADLTKLLKPSADALAPVSAKLETLGLHKDGSQIPVEVSITSLHDEAKDNLTFYAFIRDVSEHFKRAEELDKKTVYLQKAQELAKMGYWELNLVTGELFWTDYIYKLFGFDSDVTPSYEVFLEAVHPDDRKKVDDAYTDSLKTKSAYFIDHKILTPEGEKLVREHCDTIYDADGNPLRSLGVVQDITEREAALQELRVAATTFQTHAGIMITDVSGEIVRVNPAIEKMTGYTAQELIGQTPKVLQSGEQGPDFYKDMWATIDATGIWQGELWNRRKDGSLYAQWLTITSVKDEENKITHYVGTSQDITYRKEAEKRIEYLAYHDDLTGLPNRRFLKERLKHDLSTCQRVKEVGAFIILDLDNFKDLNDSLGHTVGDEVLKVIAGRLKKIVRENDTVARLGGDEFVVLLPLIGKDIQRGSFKAREIAEEILRDVSRPIDIGLAQIHCTVSIGISIFPDQSSDTDDIFKHADTALYKAKSDSKNNACFYSPQMQADVQERLQISEGLRKALEREEFCLHYQPQFNAEGKIVGSEVLVRWNHPQNGLVPPDKFIPIAEETGLIIGIGEWVLKEALADMNSWCREGICEEKDLRVAINVSPKQFLQEGFYESVTLLIKKSGIPASSIELEITENLLMDNVEFVIEKLHMLREEGIRISIDDFGTGYSSLSYLRQLPLDQLKIDQSFVASIFESKNAEVVIETIITMAKLLGFDVIAEGVETEHQKKFLIDKGCSNFQGYLFSRPLDKERFRDFLSEIKEVH